MSAPVDPTSAKKRSSTSAASWRRHQRNIDKDIKAQQDKTGGIVPYTSFNRLVHEIVQEQGDYCVRHGAVQALQEASEDVISTMFAAANNIAQYSGRETVGVTDLRFVTDPASWGKYSSVPESSAFPADDLVQ